MQSQLDMTKMEFYNFVLRISAQKSKQRQKSSLRKRLLQRSVLKNILSFTALPEAKFKEDATNFSPFSQVLSPTDRYAISLALS